MTSRLTNEPLRTWRPTPGQLTAAANKTVRDIVEPALKVLFVGINPSLYSAAVGHHFARPGNRFWPILHRAGFTDSLLSPFEDRALLRWGYGITNIVDRPTRTAAELSHAELRQGAHRLVKKIRRYRPRIVAFLGISTYRVAFAGKTAQPGPQIETIDGRPTWVLPNPSGLNAHYQSADLERLYLELRCSLKD